MFALRRSIANVTVAPKRIVFNIARSQSTDAAEYKYLTKEQRGATIWVTLNRPDVHNAFNEDVIAEITKAFRSITSTVSELSGKNPVADSTTALPRSVVLAGNGPSFSAGAGK